MNSPDPVLPPAHIPWWKSSIIRSVLVIVFAQALAKVAAHFHLTPDALANIGINADVCTQWALDGISTLAAGGILHARVKQPLPVVVLTKTKADQLNQSVTTEGTTQ